jgi:hypothetical protein
MHVGRRRPGDLNIGIVETAAAFMARGRHGARIDIDTADKAVSESSPASMSQLF